MSNDDETQSLKTEIVEETKRLLFGLKQYLEHFLSLKGDHPWRCPAMGTLSTAQHIINQILLYNSSSAKNNIDTFSSDEPESIVEYLRKQPITLGTFVTLHEEDSEFRDKVPVLKQDLAEETLAEIHKSREAILTKGDRLSVDKCGLTPSDFGKQHAWHGLQLSQDAYLCHRPASKRPYLPLRVLNDAFYQFTKKSKFSDADLVIYRSAAENLAKALTAALSMEADWRQDILKSMYHQEKIHLLPLSTMLWLAMCCYGELD